VKTEFFIKSVRILPLFATGDLDPDAARILSVFLNLLQEPATNFPAPEIGGNNEGGDAA
jgi:hypothetical protein